MTRNCIQLFTLLLFALGTALFLFQGCRPADEVKQASANQETKADVAPAGTRTDQEIISSFRRLWGERKPVFRNRFLGVITEQNPNDAWIVQEIISEVIPDFVVEAGTYHGGSAMLWALILENLNPEGRVITIDIKDLRERAAVEHPIARRRVDFILGSSTDPKVVAEVARRVKGKKVVVLLDSLHTAEHVFNELNAYAPMVNVGSYIIVQDTAVGPIYGVKKFLENNKSFRADRDRERFMVTNTDSGYLQRIR